MVHSNNTEVNDMGTGAIDSDGKNNNNNDMEMTVWKGFLKYFSSLLGHFIIFHQYNVSGWIILTIMYIGSKNSDNSDFS